MATRPPLSSTKIDRSMRPLLAAHSIDRSAIFVAPARPFPSAAHRHVSTGLRTRAMRWGLQVGPVGSADLAPGCDQASPLPLKRSLGRSKAL
jgi:hypothetical protein